MLNLTNLYCMFCNNNNSACNMKIVWVYTYFQNGVFPMLSNNSLYFFNANIYVRNVSNFHISSTEMRTNPAKSLEIAESDTLYRLFQNSRLTEAIHQLISHSSQDWSRRWNGPNLIVYHMNVSVGCWGYIYLNIRIQKRECWMGDW